MDSICVSVPASCRLFNAFVRVLFWAQAVVSFFLGGERCLCCGRWTFVSPLCGRCSSLFSSSSAFSKRCRVCGKPLVSEIGTCTVCRNSFVVKSADGIFPIQTYRLWKKDLLFSWKMLGNRSLSPFFASAVERRIRLVESSLSLSCLPVVPVPPRPGKMSEVGWDQVDDLCFYLKRGFGRRILPLLVRKSRTQQKKLGREQRLDGIGSSYFPVGEKKSRKLLGALFSGKIPNAVVLLDDVMTTGSTLEDCAEILKEMGVAHVYCVTLFTVA